MGLWEIILIAIGLSLDVFAYSLYRGAMVSKVQKADAAKMCGIFAGCETGALFVGVMITYIPAIRSFYRNASQLWMILASVTFLALGVFMIIRGIRKSRNPIIERKADKMNPKLVLMWALITSLDALVAGIGFGFLDFRLLVLLVVMAVATVLSVIAGLALGYRLGCSPMNRLISIGGGIVLIGGIDVMVHYFLL